MKQRIQQVAIGVLTVIVIVVATTVLAGDTDIAPKKKAQVDEFRKQWQSITQSGGLDEFLRLRSSELGAAFVGGWNECEESQTTNAKTKQYYFRYSKLFTVYALKKAEPWIVCVDYVAPHHRVVPGGYVNAGVCPIFLQPGGGDVQKTEILFTGATPKWDCTDAYPLLNTGAAGAGKGAWKTTWENESGQTVDGWVGWIVKRWWIRVPVAQPEGSTKVTLHVTATGPFGEAKSMTKENNEEFTLAVVSEPVPTREQIFALWGCALEVGDSMLNYTNDETNRESYRPVLTWLNDILLRLEKSPKKETQELVKAMREHALYREHIIDALKKKDAK